VAGDIVQHARRHRALTALREGLAQILTGNGSSAALASEMAARAAAVAIAASPSTDRDLEARHLLGWWHWLCDIVFPAGTGQPDLEMAVTLLEPFAAISPDAVPQPILQHLAQRHESGNALDIEEITAFMMSQGAEAFRSIHQSTTLFLGAAATRARHHPSDGHPSNLDIALQSLFTHTGDVQILEESVRVMRKAATNTSLNHPDRSSQLSTFGLALQALYDRTRDAGVLDEVVRIDRELVSRTPPGHPDRTASLSRLGMNLQDLFRRTGEVQLLEESVPAIRETVANTPPGHPDHTAHQSRLSRVLEDAFHRTGVVAVLEEAVQVSREIVADTPPDRPDRGAHLNNLSFTLRKLFDQTGRITVLEEAVQVIRETLASTPPSHLVLTDQLSRLGHALQELFHRTGDVAVLEDMVRVFRETVTRLPRNDDRIEHLISLARALLSLSVYTGNTAILDEVAQITREAVASRPFKRPTDSSRTVRTSGTSSGLFIARAERKADATVVVAEAARASREAVTSAPPHHRIDQLSNAGATLLSLFARTGELGVLEEAVRVGREAVAGMSSGDPARAEHLSRLGLALQSLFARTGELGVLEEAVRVGREAVAGMSSGDPARAEHLSRLGLALQSLFTRTGELGVLEDAIQVSREAVASTPPSRPHEVSVRPTRAAHLSVLSTTLRTLFDHTGDVTVLGDAIRVAREALRNTTQFHRDHAAHLAVLGTTLRTLFDRTGEVPAWEEARTCYVQAAGMESAAADVRLSAAHQAIALDLAPGTDAMDMAEQAADLLPLVAPRRLLRPDRAHRITQFAGLASTIATAAITAGHPDRAVELLEQTRGLLITDTLDTRGDLSQLHHYAPDLAVEFTTLRELIDHADHISTLTEPATPPEPDCRDAVDNREQRFRQWHHLLTRIRAIPELSGFLLPPPIQQLQHAAAEGPIVYIIIHPHSSHALILRDNPHHPVHTIALPALTPDTATEHLTLLRTAQHTASTVSTPADQHSAQQQILQVLGWLWDTITHPVLGHLGHTTTPDTDPWPRIWWCPVGLATFFPLHASGHHPTTPTAIDHHTNTVMDRVISSYTPTARALLHTRTTPTHPHTDPPRTVIIAVPDAPNTPPLHGVTTEATHLRHLLPTATLLPTPGTTTTHDTITTALTTHHIAHFACHGLTNWAEPATSHLLLHDHHTHPLTVTDIARLRLTHAELAYLSACSTTDTNPHHADEATHLTAAFQLAGYHSVIGTLWPINDRAATTITRHVYTHLTHNGTTPPNPHHAAHALHRATRHHRNTHPNQPTQWAAYIHTGR
jgi:hypothetical protein